LTVVIIISVSDQRKIKYVN